MRTSVGLPPLRHGRHEEAKVLFCESHVCVEPVSRDEVERGAEELGEVDEEAGAEEVDAEGDDAEQLHAFAVLRRAHNFVDGGSAVQFFGEAILVVQGGRFALFDAGGGGGGGGL